MSLQKEPLHLSCKPHLSTGRLLEGRNLFFSRQKPQLSQPFLTGESSVSLIFFVSILWICSNRSMFSLCWWSQRWIQYSRWDLQRAEQRERISFLTLLAIYLLKQTRKHLTFWAVSAYCWLMLSFTNAPKSFSSGRSYCFTSMLVFTWLDQRFLPELLFYVSKENRDLCSCKKPRKKTNAFNILLFNNIYFACSIYA